MPIDSHSYLVGQGWTGKGHGLRHGAISRPLAISQKKTLSGVGKDRDEAFPFWDHLFSAAAKSITVKISDDNDDGGRDDLPSEQSLSTLKLTSTGIPSNKRPIYGVLASSSGDTTPDRDLPISRSNLLANAKREAAKRGLYARFFRGPVLGPGVPELKMAEASAGQSVESAEEKGGSLEASKKAGKKRKIDDSERREKEARRAKRRAASEEKEKRRLAKALRKEQKATRNSTLVSPPPEDQKKENRKRKRLEVTADDSDEQEVKKHKKKRKQEATIDDAMPLPPDSSRNHQRRTKSSS